MSENIFYYAHFCVISFLNFFLSFHIKFDFFHIIFGNILCLHRVFLSFFNNFLKSRTFCLTCQNKEYKMLIETVSCWNYYCLINLSRFLNMKKTVELVIRSLMISLSFVSSVVCLYFLLISNLIMFISKNSPFILSLFLCSTLSCVFILYCLPVFI